MIDTSAGRTVQALVAAGLVTELQLAHANETSAQRSSSPLEALIESGAVDRRDVVRTAATSAGLTYVELADYTVNSAAAALLSPDFARRSNVLPLNWEDGALLVAVGIRQAGNIELKDDLTRLTKSRIRFAVAGRSDIEAKIDLVYRADGEMHELTSDLVEDDAGEDLASFTEVSARLRSSGS
jgi:type IV pilus assembly protein PilB